MKISASILAASLGWAASSWAAATGTTLDTVTVAGTRTEMTLKDNPASVSVLERKQIEQKGADSIAELLRDIPGVMVADSSAAGMKRIRMRGESSRRVTILVDGQEITDHSTFGTPILINPANVERIEVVRGPASVLYGAKAIGGVLNIVTRQGSERAVELELGSTWDSSANGRQGYAALSGRVERFDYRLALSGEDFQDRTVAQGPYSPSDKLDGTSFENTDINLHLGYQLGADKNHKLSVKANQYRLSTDSWTDPATIADPIKEFSIKLPKRDLNKYGLYYDGKPSAGPIKRIQADGFYQWVDRDFSNHVKVDPGVIVVEVDSTSIDRNINYGGSAQLDFNLPQNHELIAGMQYLMDDLDTHKSTTQQVNGFFDPQGSGQRNSHVNMQTLSLFSQYVWHLHEDWMLSAGARLYAVQTDMLSTSLASSAHDKRSNNSQAVKSLGLTYSGLDYTSLRALYSQGYIMPTLLQMYTDTSAGRGVTTYGNPELRPETSQNFELGARTAHLGWMLDAAAFYTKAHDYISSSPCNPVSLCPSGAKNSEFININADSAQSYGLEFQLEYNLEPLLVTPYVSGTWMRRELTQGSFSTYHTNTPRYLGKAGVRYEHFFSSSEAWLDVFVRSASESSYQASAGSTVSRLAGYSTWHLSLGGGLGANSQYQWSLHLNNLLDKSYRSSPEELPGAGRSAVLGVHAKF
ncbi:MAG: hypothetical protein RL217_1842 [Pseudomonadota bacterium]